MRCLALLVAALTATNFWGFVDAGSGFQGKASTLTVATFDEYLDNQRAKKRGCIIMFHVSWCKVCQRSFPEFAAASVTVDKADMGVDFAHVDCEADKPLCQRFAVKGYPTIKLFSEDASIEPRNFRGSKKEQGFIKFIERMTQPPVLRLADRDGLAKAAFNETFASFVAAVPAESEMPGGLLQAANEWMDRHRFGAAPSQASLLAEGAEIPDGATLAAVAHSEQLWRGGTVKGSGAAPAALAFYTGSLDDAGALSKWVEANRFPGVWLLQEANFYEFTHANRSAVIVAVDFSEKLSKGTEDAVLSAAAKFHESFLFGVINGGDFVDELANFGLRREDLPRVLVTESNFEYWIEDIEELRASHLETDLQALLDGAPVLRQDRTSWSKIEYYRREFLRKTKVAQEYAKKGRKESAIVFLACMSGSFVLWLAWKFLCMVFGALLSEPDFPEYPIKRD